MNQYILAIDQGTTSSRSIIFDQKSTIISKAQEEFTQHFPHPGWVEHDALQIWETQLSTIKKAIASAQLNTNQIAAIGITNQRETTVVWDKHSGIPIYNAIVWQDKRTASICDKLKADGWESYTKKNTGLLIDSYFSATKLHWILKNVEGAAEKAKRGDLLFGTIDTWLIWKLTGGNLHITDYSNASRTMMYNIVDLCWDTKILEALEIPASMLPQFCDSSALYGTTDTTITDGVAIPIAGIAGDQQAALFGQCCYETGMAKNTYGTGCFMLMNTGKQMVQSNHGLLTTIAWGLNGEITYALEGSVFIAGAAIQWLRDGLHFFTHSSESEALAVTVPDSDGVYVVPAFVGLGAPYWNMNVRGAIYGIHRGTTQAHICRATLESLAYQSKDVIESMEKDAHIQLKELRVDGGASNNDLLMQFQSDILQTRVVRPPIIETTALGVAYLAGLAVGYYQLNELIQQSNTSVYNPSMSTEQADKLYKGWQLSIRKTLLEA
ncbi:MAG: glycerol kinase GlpK [Bacteroidota bacterium]